MNWYKKAKNQIVQAYHGLPKPFDKFDPQFSDQGVFWFSDDINEIKNETSGAVSNKYIAHVELFVNKTAGWEEYDNKYLQQIDDDGFDSIHIDHNWIIFDSNRITIKNWYKKTENGNYKLV